MTLILDESCYSLLQGFPLSEGWKFRHRKCWNFCVRKPAVLPGVGDFECSHHSFLQPLFMVNIPFAQCSQNLDLELKYHEQRAPWTFRQCLHHTYMCGCIIFLARAQILCSRELAGDTTTRGILELKHIFAAFQVLNYSCRFQELKSFAGEPNWQKKKKNAGSLNFVLQWGRKLTTERGTRIRHNHWLLKVVWEDTKLIYRYLEVCLKRATVLKPLWKIR